MYTSMFSSTCIPVYVYTSIPVYQYMCIPVYVYTSICVYQYTCIPVYVYTSMPVYVYTSIPVYMYTRIRVYVYTSIPVYVYTSFQQNVSRLICWLTQTGFICLNTVIMDIFARKVNILTPLTIILIRYCMSYWIANSFNFYSFLVFSTLVMTSYMLRLSISCPIIIIIIIIIIVISFWELL